MVSNSSGESSGINLESPKLLKFPQLFKTAEE
jgi:hypothetical protein